MGSGLEGQPGQWRSQIEDKTHDYKMLEKQHRCKGSWGWSPSCLLSTHGEAAHAKGLFISELHGYPSNPGKEVALTSPGLSFLKWEITSNEWSRSGQTRVCTAWSTAQEVKWLWKPEGEGKWEEKCFNYNCSRLFTFSGPQRKCKLSKEEESYKITVLRFGWGDDKRIIICTFGFSTCSVLSCLCDLC